MTVRSGDAGAAREGPPGSRLRVGLVHWAFPPTTGGVESHVADLARVLSANGCSVTVLTGEPSPVTPPGIDVVHTHLLNLDWIRSGGAGGVGYAQELEAFFGQAIEGGRYEVVHGHNLHHFTPEPALTLERLRRRLRFRLHHTFHETWPDLLHDRPVYRAWDGNYAVSRFVQEECRARLGFEPELAHLGVDVDRFQSARPPLSSALPVILHPARLLPWKGVHTSVEMLALLVERGLDARLVITDTQRIADWNRELVAYRQLVLRLMEELGLEQRVRFVPASYAEMPSIYEAADIVVYPTVDREPFGLVPLEAMSCCRPVVASRCGGIVETVVDGVTGYLVEPEDVESLAERTMRLATHPQLARGMGAAGRRHVCRSFGLGSYVKRLLESYEGRRPAMK